MTEKSPNASLFDNLSAAAAEQAQKPIAPADLDDQQITAEYLQQIEEALQEHGDLAGVVSAINELSKEWQNSEVKQLASLVATVAGAVALKMSHLQDQIDDDAPEEMVQAVLELVTIIRDIKTASDKNSPGLKKLISDKLKQAEDIVSDILGDEEEGEALDGRGNASQPSSARSFGSDP